MFAKPLVTVLGSATIALMASISGMSTAVADTPGYWSTKSGEVWRTGYGECWRTQFWKPENAIAECEGIADSDGDGVADDKDNCPNTPAGVAVNSNGCELDSDGDGVVDSKDNCSGTAAGTNVDTSGCKHAESDSDGDGVVDSKDRCSNTSAGARVNSSGCEVDSDSDGVADSQDRCPGSPVGIRVDASGCERDSDGDGIVDSRDSCSSSRSGEKVDAQGCKLEEKIVLKGVNFQTSSDALAGSSFSSLDEIAATLKRYSSMKVEVAGYTDNRGAVSYNQSLSQQRAEAVVDYLVSKGVPAANLTAKGYGPDSPIADNSSTSGRAENRRVELHILER